MTINEALSNLHVINVSIDLYLRLMEKRKKLEIIREK